jgi:hypothetical protein
MIRIGVLHGAIEPPNSNSNDSLIFERGKKLLEHFFNSEIYNFNYIVRNKPFKGDFDGLIILGGPLISRTIYEQSKNIIEYIKDKNITIVCLGLGLSGENFKSAKSYFLDIESILFWKYVYGTSKLFSVRDELTYEVLKQYGIDAEVTACPALFDRDGKEQTPTTEEVNKILVSIPDLTVKSLSHMKLFYLTLYYLWYLKRKLPDKRFGVTFVHGYSLPQRVIKKFAAMLGIKTHDTSKKSLDAFPELYDYDVQIGTRLHSTIFFLSINKPSFLFNVDMRTEGFLKTIDVPSDKYTISGIKNLVNMLADRIAENDFEYFNNVFNDITSLYSTMKNFLRKTYLFYI